MPFIKILLLAFTCFSCVAQKKREIAFKMENDLTITTYLKEKKIDFSNNQMATLKGIATFGKYGRTDKLAVPEAYFFNSKGELIKNKGNGVSCGMEIKKLEKISKMKSDPNQSLENFLNDITVLDGSKVTNENVDVYIIITWAKFAASESETSLNWFSNLKKQENLKVKVLLLNLDVQEKWNITEDQRKHLGIH